MPGSNYLRSATINHFLRGLAQPSPPVVYLALFVSDPTPSNTGTEVSGGGYERIPITFDTPIISADKTTTYNISKVEYSVATADWNTVTDWAVYTAKNAGELLFFDHFETSQTIVKGNQVAFNPNDCTINVK